MEVELVSKNFDLLGKTTQKNRSPQRHNPEDRSRLAYCPARSVAELCRANIKFQLFSMCSSERHVKNWKSKPWPVRKQSLSNIKFG